MTQLTVACPRCQTPAAWQGNAFRPFCSERCKLIDFGAWANEDYRLKTEDSPQHDPKKAEDDYDD
ncbi:MAG: DNA gyrase inhibitor YacG [Acinetobacter sp.]|nr:DNA gyrase inhibitor YacG [Acinetobacter sp.]